MVGTGVVGAVVGGTVVGAGVGGLTGSLKFETATCTGPGPRGVRCSLTNRQGFVHAYWVCSHERDYVGGNGFRCMSIGCTCPGRYVVPLQKVRFERVLPCMGGTYCRRASERVLTTYLVPVTCQYIPIVQALDLALEGPTKSISLSVHRSYHNFISKRTYLITADDSGRR